MKFHLPHPTKTTKRWFSSVRPTPLCSASGDQHLVVKHGEFDKYGESRCRRCMAIRHREVMELAKRTAADFMAKRAAAKVETAPLPTGGNSFSCFTPMMNAEDRCAACGNAQDVHTNGRCP